MMAAGALLAMPTGGGLTARFGSAPVTRVAALMLCATMPLPVLAPSLPWLFLAVLLFGAAVGGLDVAMNAHGIAVEARLPRPTMSALHGMWSLGGLAGAGVAALLLGRMPGGAHVLTMAALTAVAMWLVMRRLLPPIDAGARGGARFRRPRGAAVGLGALAMLALLSEGAILDWSAVYMRTVLGTEPGLAAAGFAAFSATMAGSRFAGDWVRQRLGAVALVRASALFAGLGLAGGLLIGTPAAAIGGFACAGLGLANVVPILFSGGGRLPDQAPGAGIAAVAGGRHRRRCHHGLCRFPGRAAADRLCRRGGELVGGAGAGCRRLCRDRAGGGDDTRGRSADRGDRRRLVCWRKVGTRPRHVCLLSSTHKARSSSLQ